MSKLARAFGVAAIIIGGALLLLVVNGYPSMLYGEEWMSPGEQSARARTFIISLFLGIGLLAVGVYSLLKGQQPLPPC